MVREFFFDAYAIIEIFKQNKEYNKYSDTQITTNALHLAEAYYYLIKVYNEKTADYLIKNIDISLMDISYDITIRSTKFRYINRKKKLSYADCIGYITAQKLGLKFLTGDKEFKGMKNVEFVK